MVRPSQFVTLLLCLPLGLGIGAVSVLGAEKAEVKDGLKSGQLTPGEARSLLRTDKVIKTEKEKAAKDGFVDSTEQTKLDKLKVKQEKKEDKLKENDRKTIEIDLEADKDKEEKDPKDAKKKKKKKKTSGDDNLTDDDIDKIAADKDEESIQEDDKSSKKKKKKRKLSTVIDEAMDL